MYFIDDTLDNSQSCESQNIETPEVMEISDINMEGMYKAKAGFTNFVHFCFAIQHFKKVTCIS